MSGGSLTLSRSAVCLHSQERRSVSGYKDGAGSCSASGRLSATTLGFKGSALAPGTSPSAGTTLAGTNSGRQAGNSNFGAAGSGFGDASGANSFMEALKEAVLKLDELSTLGKESSRPGAIATAGPVSQQLLHSMVACQGPDKSPGPLLNLLIGKACEVMLAGLEQSDEQLVGLVPPPSAALVKLRRACSGTASLNLEAQNAASLNSRALGALTLVTPLMAVLDRLKWLQQLVLSQEAEGRGASSRVRRSSMMVVPNNAPELLVTAPVPRSTSKGTPVGIRAAGTQTAEVSRKSEGTHMEAQPPVVYSDSATQTDSLKNEKDKQEPSAPSSVEAGAQICASTSECGVQANGSSTAAASSQTQTASFCEKMVQTGQDFRERWLQHVSCQTEPPPAATLAPKQQHQTVRILRIARMERRPTSGKGPSESLTVGAGSGGDAGTGPGAGAGVIGGSGGGSPTVTPPLQGMAAASSSKVCTDQDQDLFSLTATGVTKDLLKDAEAQQPPGKAGSLRCPRGHGLQWIRRAESSGRDAGLHCGDCAGPIDERHGLHTCALCFTGTGERYVLCQSCSRKRHEDETSNSLLAALPTLQATPTTQQRSQTMQARQVPASTATASERSAPSSREGSGHLDTGRFPQAEGNFKTEVTPLGKSASAGTLRAPISNPVLRQRKDASYPRGREWSLVSAGGSAASIPKAASQQAEAFAAELASSGL